MGYVAPQPRIGQVFFISRRGSPGSRLGRFGTRPRAVGRPALATILGRFFAVTFSTRMES